MSDEDQATQPDCDWCPAARLLDLSSCTNPSCLKEFDRD